MCRCWLTAHGVCLPLYQPKHTACTGGSRSASIPHRSPPDSLVHTPPVVDPNASLASLRAFAQEVMPAFGQAPAAAAE